MSVFSRWTQVAPPACLHPINCGSVCSIFPIHNTFHYFKPDIIITRASITSTADQISITIADRNRQTPNVKNYES